MIYPRPLEKTIIIKRYKRFFADVKQKDGSTLVCHVPNTGPMKGSWQEGWTCYVMAKEKPKKLTHGVELVKDNEGNLLGINTQLPNKLVEEYIIEKGISSISSYTKHKREYKVGKSKIDFYLTGEDLPDCFLEVKNCSGKKNGVAFFPDTVSERAIKHLNELMDLNKKGYKSVLVFVVQRNDVNSFTPGDEHHPEYGVLLRKAIKEGVEVYAFGCSITLKEVKINRSLKLIL